MIYKIFFQGESDVILPISLHSRHYGSSLQTAAEKVGWPMPVDYHSASVEDRSVFENSFRNLLKLQKMSVVSCYSFVFLQLKFLKWRKNSNPHSNPAVSEGWSLPLASACTTDCSSLQISF